MTRYAVEQVKKSENGSVPATIAERMSSKGPARSASPAGILYVSAFLVGGLLSAVSCTAAHDNDPDSEGPSFGACERLFGVPTSNAGLSDEQCGPTCAACGMGGAAAEDFVPPAYDSDAIATLREWTLTNPPDVLSEDPYAAPPQPQDDAEVCAFMATAEREYELATFASFAAAAEAGASVTHTGACGQCSSLRDLSVYIETPELTDPVRGCSLQHFGGTAEELATCIGEIGFTDACARIWAYNSQNTASACQDVCLDLLGSPHHEEDGSLNACLECDEEQSGPVFQAVAGRTRRNSGLPSALCRPCDTVARLTHGYAL